MLMCMNSVECAPSRTTKAESYDTVGHSQLNLVTKYLPLFLMSLKNLYCNKEVT